MSLKTISMKTVQNSHACVRNIDEINLNTVNSPYNEHNLQQYFGEVHYIETIPMSLH